MLAVGGAFKSGAYEGFAKASAETLQRPRRFYWQTRPLTRTAISHPWKSARAYAEGHPCVGSWEYMDPRGISMFNREKIVFTRLEDRIGQFPFEFPCVFNFFFADYNLPMSDVASPESESEAGKRMRRRCRCRSWRQSSRSSYQIS